MMLVRVLHESTRTLNLFFFTRNDSFKLVIAIVVNLQKSGFAILVKISLKGINLRG